MSKRIRRAIEYVLPWFDREQADRESAAIRLEITASKAIREQAQQVMSRDESMRYGYRQYGASGAFRKRP